MTNLSRTVIGQIQDMSWHVSTCRTLADVETSAVQWLYDNLPCDYASFSEYPAYPNSGRIRAAPWDVDVDQIESSLRQHYAVDPATDHPLVGHYSDPGNSLTPLRISDLVSSRQWRSTRVYADVFGQLRVARQIPILTRRSPSTAYAVMRTGSDFSDDELGLAIGIQPVMTAVQQLITALARPSVPSDAANRFRLTPTELEVLTLLATGMTATAIGHVRRVSRRTVCKHLESIYHKLGLHDRLQVVTYARGAGLIPPGPPNGAPT